jgi:hypothetical protein
MREGPFNNLPHSDAPGVVRSLSRAIPSTSQIANLLDSR